MRSLAASIVVCAGCSFVMTERPKPPPQDPACTRSYASVGLDIAGALTWPFVLGAAYVVSRADDGDLDDSDAATTGLIIGGTFVAHVVSAIVGVSRVGDCRDAYATRARYPVPHPYPYPYPYGPPPPPYPYPAPPQPAPPATQPYPPQPQAPPAPPRGLGIEGDACSATVDCAAGLACTAGRCVRG